MIGPGPLLDARLRDFCCAVPLRCCVLAKAHNTLGILIQTLAYAVEARDIAAPNVSWLHS